MAHFNTFNTVNELINTPLLFLKINPKKSTEIINECAKLYRTLKSNNKSSLLDPLNELFVTGFDDEQIWQQIDIFNNNIIEICAQGTSVCLNNWVQLGIKPSEVEEASDELLSNGGSIDDIEESVDNVSVSESCKSIEKKEVFERTEVDDDFFSLREMEKFLDEEDSENQPFKNNDEINYFDEIPSTDDDDNCDKNSSFEIDSDDDILSHVENIEEKNENIEDDETKKSARQVKYDEYFSNSLHEKHFDKEKIPTNFEKQQRKVSQQIRNLEEQALGEQPWQMKGEALASSRPVNSLLEEVLTFDHSERLAPEITDDHTYNLEAIICQRIKDKSWDDVERKIKDIKDPNEYKKKVVLESDQSKLSLQEIYEQEYLAKVTKTSAEDKDNPAHIELNKLMTDLFTQLDGLANYRFRSAVPEPTIKVLTNIPSINVEEVMPVTHTNADMLAPEEIHNIKEVKENSEKTTTDRKRERRKKVARQKARAKARMDKLQKLADTDEKLKTLKAVKQLQQASNRKSGRTTIIQNTSTTKKRQMSSKSFFNKIGKTSVKN